MASINNNVDVDYDVEIWDYNKHLNPSEVVDLLNELYEENKLIKRQILEPLWTTEYIRKLEKENKQLKQQIDELEFKLRTIEAYDRTVKEEHSDSVYVFEKKLEKW